MKMSRMCSLRNNMCFPSTFRARTAICGDPGVGSHLCLPFQIFLLPRRVTVVAVAAGTPAAFRSHLQLRPLVRICTPAPAPPPAAAQSPRFGRLRNSADDRPRTAPRQLLRRYPLHGLSLQVIVALTRGNLPVTINLVSSAAVRFPENFPPSSALATARTHRCSARHRNIHIQSVSRLAWKKLSPTVILGRVHTVNHPNHDRLDLRAA